MENLVLISHIIPMSIYVAIEVLKFFQVRLIMSDSELVTEQKGDKRKNKDQILGMDASVRKKVTNL